MKVKRTPEEIKELVDQVTLDWEDGDFISIIAIVQAHNLTNADRKLFFKEAFEVLESEGLSLFKLHRSRGNESKDQYLVVKIARVLGFYKLRMRPYIPPAPAPTTNDEVH